MAIVEKGEKKSRMAMSLLAIGVTAGVGLAAALAYLMVEVRRANRVLTVIRTVTPTSFDFISDDVKQSTRVILNRLNARDCEVRRGRHGL